jgi:cysteine desulfurase
MKQRRVSSRVYLDFAAATPLSPKAKAAYVRALDTYGNPSAPHTEGRAARDMIEDARVRVARSLSVKAPEIVFTSGGTESNNIALQGIVVRHAVTTTIEHSSVLDTFRILESRGTKVTYVAPNADGVVQVSDILKALKPTTDLVSVVHVASESGVVQPVADIGLALRKLERKIIFHVDAAQSPLWLDASPNTLRADLVSYDAQKVQGPKGVGVLYRDYAVPLVRSVGGGTQERGIRPGTENTPAIVAAGVAFEEAYKGRKARALKVSKLRDHLISEIKKQIPDAIIVGSIKRRVANNVFVSIPTIDGDYLAVLMDTEGVAVTPRSACIGSGGGTVPTTIRFSLSPTSSRSDLKQAVSALVKVVPLARR